MQEQRRHTPGEGTPDDSEVTANKEAKALVAKAEKFLVDSAHAMEQARKPEEKRSSCGCGF